MAGTKEYKIVINGVQESINALDALVAKAEELGRKLSGGITVDVKPQVQQPQQANTAQAQSAEKTFTVQAQITAEIEKQNTVLSQQTSIVSSQSSSYKDALDVATSILGTYEQNIAKLAEYDSKLKEIASQKKAVQDIGVENEQTRAIMQELLADEIKYKQLKSETASILKTETKLLQAEEGSYDQMSAAVGRLRDALRASNGNLSPEQFNAISQAVSTLDQELKDADKGMGNFFRNVGNYPSAAEGFSKIKVEIAGITQEFDGAKPAIMSLKNAMSQLAVEGKADTEEYKALADQMRNLQLAMVTVNDEINRSKDASAGLHDTIEMIQGFTAIATIGQGFSQLFGIDDSALGEQIKKMTSLMGILQGLNELKNQMATGTGIGDTLNKLMNMTGLNASLSQLKSSFSELMVALKSVRTQSEVTAAGFEIMAASAKVASAAVKSLWRALVIGLVIEAVVWLIEELIDGCKALYNVIHDAVSLSDDVERSNKAMADSYASLKTGIEGYLAARDREVASGVRSQYEADADKLSALNKALEQNIKLSRTSIDLAAENAGITPKLGDWTRLSQEIENIQRLQAEGREETSAWGDVYKDVLADVIARMNDLDTADSNALQNFVLWTKESPQVQAALTWALNSGDDSMKALAESIQNGSNNAAELVNMIYQVQAAMRAAEVAADNFNKRWDYIQKYGRNAQNEMSRDKELEENRKYNKENQKLLEKREKQINDYYDKQEKEQNTHGRKQVSVAKRTNNDLLNLERQLQQDKLAIMRDGLTKTLAQIEYERRRRLEAIDKMTASESKKEEARAAAKARYDHEEAEARRKFREQYAKEEEEFQSNIRKLTSENNLSDIQTTIEQANIMLAKGFKGWGESYAKELLEPWYETLHNIGIVSNEIEEEITTLQTDIERRERMIETIKGQLANAALDSSERNQLTMDLSRMTTELKSQNDRLEMFMDARETMYETRAKLIEQINADPTNLDDNKKYFTAWNNYYYDLFNLQNEHSKRSLELQKAYNKEKTAEELSQAEEQLEAERKALFQRYEALSQDEQGLIEFEKQWRERRLKEYIKDGMEYAAAVEKSNKDVFDLEKWYQESFSKLTTSHDSKMSEIIEANRVENSRLEQEYVEERQKRYSELYDNLVNQLNKFASKVGNMESKLKSGNTDAWGFFNIKKFREEKNEVLDEYGTLLTTVEQKMQQLREDLAAGNITLGDFTNAYSELEQLKEKIGDTMNELKSDNGMEDFMKGVDTWVQQIGQAANQILSAVFDYRNSEFERMQEELDKQIELVQQKYDEMEEIAQRHKDNMSEIEDELTTARGDRRQHLIDALSTEIDAQRRALAEQKKAEKEKEKLEKQSDKLELQRKKEQKRQSLITAIINAALAISQAAANKWPVPAIPLMAVAAAVGAAQVASISAQKYAKGGLLQGPSHERGGIKVGGGIEVEGGEFVTNKGTTSKNLDLLYYINSSRKRLNVDDFIEFYSKGGGSKPLLGAKGKFADGGLMPSLEVASRTAEVIVAQDDRPVIVSVVDINDAQARVRRVQTMAGLER